MTIVLTTHDMDEAAALADRVGILDAGRLLALNTPVALIRGLATGSTLQVSVEPVGLAGIRDLPDRLGALAGVARCEQLGAEGAAHTMRLYLSRDPAALLAPVATVVAQAGGRLTGVEIAQASMEDVFIELTGRRLR